MRRPVQQLCSRAASRARRAWSRGCPVARLVGFGGWLGGHPTRPACVRPAPLAHGRGSEGKRWPSPGVQTPSAATTSRTTEAQALASATRGPVSAWCTTKCHRGTTRQSFQRQASTAGAAPSAWPAHRAGEGTPRPGRGSGHRRLRHPDRPTFREPAPEPRRRTGCRSCTAASRDATVAGATLARRRPALQLLPCESRHATQYSWCPACRTWCAQRPCRSAASRARELGLAGMLARLADCGAS